MMEPVKVDPQDFVWLSADEQWCVIRQICALGTAFHVYRRRDEVVFELDDDFREFFEDAETAIAWARNKMT